MEKVFAFFRKNLAPETGSEAESNQNTICCVFLDHQQPLRLSLTFSYLAGTFCHSKDVGFNFRWAVDHENLLSRNIQICCTFAVLERILPVVFFMSLSKDSSEKPYHITTIALGVFKARSFAFKNKINQNLAYFRVLRNFSAQLLLRVD